MIITREKVLPDMETNGVYFPEEIKIILEERKKELTCEYSGLPSVLSYMNEDDYHVGHS